jgi:predicted RNase H-like nuclease (RuvC/YqgF family)
MSKMNRLSRLALLIGKTEDDVKNEKESSLMAIRINELNRLEKLKKQNHGKEVQLENKNKEIEKLKSKLRAKDTEIESLRKKYTDALVMFKKQSNSSSLRNKRSHSVHLLMEFIEKRIVAIYGNKALFDLLNHFENPDEYLRNNFDDYKERIMKVKPFF